ncbi:MAG: phytanoyl-CoA dioxygenase family protein [Rubrivivax sp.]
MNTAALRHQFDEQGWCALPGFKTADECRALRERAWALAAAVDPGASSMFSTVQPARVSDAALIASAEAVHGFFEEEAFDAQGRLQRPVAQAINKLGHALHDLDPVFDAFSHGPGLATLAAALGLRQPQLWQSMLIFKQPGIGGEVRWHQDASFFVTDPITVTTFWFALESATLANGCLWVQPGGHRSPLRERFVRDGERLQLEPLDPLPWPTTSEAVPVEVEEGTLLCFHGLLPHYSAANRSPQSRLAYTLHVTDAGAAYAPRNWLQRRTLPLRGF